MAGILDELRGMHVWNSLAWARGSNTPETDNEERAQIHTRMDAFNVPSCFNQLDLGLNTAHDTGL